MHTWHTAFFLPTGAKKRANAVKTRGKAVGSAVRCESGRAFDALPFSRLKIDPRKYSWNPSYNCRKLFQFWGAIHWNHTSRRISPRTPAGIACVRFEWLGGVFSHMQTKSRETPEFWACGVIVSYLICFGWWWAKHFLYRRDFCSKKASSKYER